jgi:hypothetical protein
VPGGAAAQIQPLEETVNTVVYRSLSIVILLGMLFTSGCGFSLAPRVTATPTSTSTPQPSPTATITATATRRPSPTPQSPFYLEEFQGDMDGWDYFLVTNEQNAGDKVEVYPSEGGLWVKMDVRYTDVYLLNTQFDYEDVRMEFETENMGRNNNSISMICRYTDNAGWYFFLISNSGVVGIYRAELKNNKVNYVTIIQGGSEYVVMGKGTNTYAVTCKGEELSLEINGHLWRTAKDDKFPDGKIGISISAFNVLPIEVVIKWLDISKP